jgi:diaminopimelate epimerase
MELQFTKMHGLGNDFVLINALDQPVSLNADQVRRLADRHFGIGCDQLLLIEPPQNGEADVRYRIYNADGGEVEHCGNGVRCVAHYLRDEGIINRDDVVVETMKGLAHVFIERSGLVRVDMGAPGLDPAAIPMRASARSNFYEIEVAGGRVTIGAASMGNPHAVLDVDNIEYAPVQTLGPLIEHHPDFPEGVNVGFMQIVDPGRMRLRVYERGAGETLACGTGACAAVVVGRLRGRLDEEVDVELTGGHLTIAWAGEGQPVWMTGPASRVFEGQFKL